MFLLKNTPIIAFSEEVLLKLKYVYPDFISKIDNDCIVWMDGTLMPLYDDKLNKTADEILNHPALIDQITMHYQAGKPDDLAHFSPKDDPGRIRYEPFFRKMYGETEETVQTNLVTIYWMPSYFGHDYPLEVTRINGVDQKLLQISHELEELVYQHPEFLSYLAAPGGTFKWRTIANTNRISLHSFGMTIDINSDYSDYWQWDLKKIHPSFVPLIYRNQVPWEIVLIFEKYGFIWGGKWRHYDTMHFEYRPELF